jgi:hypothetical protein
MAFKNMGDGWKKVIPRIGAMAGEQGLTRRFGGCDDHGTIT